MEEKLNIIARTSRQNMEQLFRQLCSPRPDENNTQFSEVDITDWSSNQVITK